MICGRRHGPFLSSTVATSRSLTTLRTQHHAHDCLIALVDHRICLAEMAVENFGVFVDMMVSLSLEDRR